MNRDQLGRTDPQSGEMQISERELRSMTRELEELHESTFPSVRKVLDDITANMVRVVRKPSTRRTFVLGAAGAVALGAAAACSTSSTGTSPSSAAKPDANTYTGDLQVVALAAALENLAVTAYGGALKLAGEGKLGVVPPAVAEFVVTAQKQHADHSAAWNSVLSKAGKPTIADAPLSITADQVAMLNASKSVGDAAKVALVLEDAAAQTYTFATANVTDAGGIMTAATIQPVEAMHAAILNFVLGQYPVPNSFIAVDGAIKPTVLQFG